MSSRGSEAGRVFPARAVYGPARASARTARKFGAGVAVAVTDDRRVDSGRFARRIERGPVRGGFQRPPRRSSFRRSLWPRSC